MSRWSWAIPSLVCRRLRRTALSDEPPALVWYSSGNSLSLDRSGPIHKSAIVALPRLSGVRAGNRPLSRMEAGLGPFPQNRPDWGRSDPSFSRLGGRPAHHVLTGASRDRLLHEPPPHLAGRLSLLSLGLSP